MSGFKSLNIDDKSILINLTIYLINFICSKFHFDKDSIDIKQWTQNNNRDIKACILKILPYIDDKDNFIKYKKLEDLNHILYNRNDSSINKSILNESIDENLKTYFKTSNFSLGLMSRDFEKLNQGSILNLIDQSGDKLIHKIIHDNFKKEIFYIRNIYKDEKKVNLISGFNYLTRYKNQNGHQFSKYTDIWGWATWKDRWEIYPEEKFIWEKIRTLFT